MVTVRPAEPDEGRAVLDLHQASSRAFGPAAYDEAQVAAWADANSADYPTADDDHRFVVTEQAGELAGFGDLHWSESQITGVYVHPDHARVGAGTAILDDLEGAASSRGLDELGLLASKNAVGFRADAGYGRVETRSHRDRRRGAGVCGLRSRSSDDGRR